MIHDDDIIYTVEHFYADADAISMTPSKNTRSYTLPGLIKMRSRLGTQFMAFFRLIARILTFRDKKYRILTFRDKTESYLTAHSLSGSLCLFLALSGSHSSLIWLPLALSGSLWLSIALQICFPSPCSAHKALAQLGTPFLRSLTLISPDSPYRG